MREFADRGITVVTNTLRRLQEASEPCSLYTIHGESPRTAACLLPQARLAHALPHDGHRMHQGWCGHGIYLNR